MTKTCDKEAELDDKADLAKRLTECGYKRNTVDKSLQRVESLYRKQLLQLNQKETTAVLKNDFVMLNSNQASHIRNIIKHN